MLKRHQPTDYVVTRGKYQVREFVEPALAAGSDQ
jgi:hypothetical protein